MAKVEFCMKNLLRCVHRLHEGLHRTQSMVIHNTETFLKFFQGYHKYILLEVLLCSIAERGVPSFDEPFGRVKIQTTSKNSQRYYKTSYERLFNTPNRYVRAGEFLTGPLEYKYHVIFVLVLGVICTVRSAVG